MPTSGIVAVAVSVGVAVTGTVSPFGRMPSRTVDSEPGVPESSKGCGVGVWTTGGRLTLTSAGSDFLEWSPSFIAIVTAAPMTRTAAARERILRGRPVSTAANSSTSSGSASASSSGWGCSVGASSQLAEPSAPGAGATPNPGPIELEAPESMEAPASGAPGSRPARSWERPRKSVASCPPPNVFGRSAELSTSRAPVAGRLPKLPMPSDSASPLMSVCSRSAIATLSQAPGGRGAPFGRRPGLRLWSRPGPCG